MALNSIHVRRTHRAASGQIITRFKPTQRVWRLVVTIALAAYAAHSQTAYAQQAPNVTGSSFNIDALANGIVNRSRQGELTDASGRFGWAGIGLSGSYTSLAQAMVATTRNGVVHIRSGANVSGTRVDIKSQLMDSLNEGGQIGNGLLLIGE